MIVGNPSVFAIESGITHAYERLSFRAIGYFIIWVCGRSYGVRSPDATMLACSFDEVGRRIANRGGHTARFAADLDPGKIADAIRLALYADCRDDELLLGIPLPEFGKLICSQRIQWAPDGDEAFDDRSYVLQFEVDDRVRLIAFTSSGESYLHDPTTLSDAWLPSDDFYCVLQQWHDAFEAEWTAVPRKS
jgi:Immunity protein 42